MQVSLHSLAYYIGVAKIMQGEKARTEVAGVVPELRNRDTRPRPPTFVTAGDRTHQYPRSPCRNTVTGGEPVAASANAPNTAVDNDIANQIAQACIKRAALCTISIQLLARHADEL
jgi:hypothetical protein